VLGTALAAAALLSGCASGPTAAGSKFVPAKRGVLTVATSFLPAPGFWQGSPPMRGFEAGLAADGDGVRLIADGDSVAAEVDRRLARRDRIWPRA
jgi:hypothetical protein